MNKRSLRDEMVEAQDPDLELSPEAWKAFNDVYDQMHRVRQEIQNMGTGGQDWSWLNFGKAYIPHDYQFDSADFFNFLKKRKYATYHDVQMDGYVPRTEDFFLLAGHFMLRMYALKADQEMIAGLRRGKTNDGAPLAMNDASSGYRPVASGNSES